MKRTIDIWNIIIFNYNQGGGYLFLFSLFWLIEPHPAGIVSIFTCCMQQIITLKTSRCICNVSLIPAFSPAPTQNSCDYFNAISLKLKDSLSNIWWRDIQIIITYSLQIFCKSVLHLLSWNKIYVADYILLQWKLLTSMKGLSMG